MKFLQNGDIDQFKLDSTHQNTVLSLEMKNQQETTKHSNLGAGFQNKTMQSNSTFDDQNLMTPKDVNPKKADFFV